MIINAHPTMTKYMFFKNAHKTFGFRRIRWFKVCSPSIVELSQKSIRKR